MRTLKNQLLCTGAHISLVAMMLLFIGCGEDPNSATFTPNEQPEEVFDVAVTQEEAMSIALTAMDPDIYQSTSTISGPMNYHDKRIYSYQVTVNGGDHLYLRFVDGETGELLNDLDERHEIPQENELPEDALAAYYPSRPSGWPLWISINYFYSQNDFNWAGEILGYGPSTIGSAGCLLTAYAMTFRYFCITTKNPKELNSYAKSNGCFSGDYLDGKKLTKKFCWNHKVIDHNSIWGEIAAGRPVIAYGCEDWWSNVYAHAMVLYGHDGSKYWGKDPYYDWINQDQPLHMHEGCTSAGNYRVVY